MKQSRVLVVLGVMLLGLASFLPLWRIELEAPQYPEPIGLYIHINTLRGIGEHDLENINILNHYIGMKPIEPESIPELRFMPWILAALIGLGGLAFAVPRRWLIAVWIAAIAFAGTLGLYDFDQWEREYGSNLNPNAPIKIEGMMYKPPLIGTKQLLNITAHSYPSWGGWSILGALACGIGAWWHAGRSSRKRVPIEKALIVLLALNPVDAVRVALLLHSDASALMGITGAALREYFGTGRSLLVIALVVIGWIGYPLLRGERIFCRRDFY